MSDFYIDTHCHLDLFKEIQHTAKQENGFPIKTITVTNSPDFYGPNNLLFSEFKNIRVALGLHPELVAKFHQKVELFSQMIDKTQYIGEIGLDGSKSFESSFELQQLVFEAILNMVKFRQNKVLTVHSRNASKVTIDLLNKYLEQTTNKVILHWFSGSKADLKRAIDMGFYFSVNHKMAYSESGRNLITQIPIDRLLTETDAPFTFDNKITNRLQSLEICISLIAQFKEVDTAFIKKTVYENFKSILS